MIEARIDTSHIPIIIAELQRMGSADVLLDPLKRSASQIQSAGKARLRERRKRVTGNLARSFKTNIDTKNISAKIGFRKGIGGGNHAAMVNKGTIPRYTEEGYRRGVMPASFFWTDTKNKEEKEAYDNVYSAVQQAVNKLNARR